MTLSYRFFADGTEYSQYDFAELVGDCMSNGYVLGLRDELQVVASNPASMVVKVSTGRGYISNTQSRGYSFDVEDTAYGITLQAANSSYPRIDRIIAKVSETTNRKITLEVKTGTPSASPTAPTLTQSADTYEVSLAQIYVGAGVTSITEANITDERASQFGVAGVKSAVVWLNSAQTVRYAISGVASGVADRDTIRFDGTNWVKDTQIPTGVYDAANSAVVIAGYLDGFSGLTAGTRKNRIIKALTATTALIVPPAPSVPLYASLSLTDNGMGTYLSGNTKQAIPGIVALATSGTRSASISITISATTVSTGRGYMTIGARDLISGAVRTLGTYGSDSIDNGYPYTTTVSHNLSLSEVAYVASTSYYLTSGSMSVSVGSVYLAPAE